MTFNLTYNNNDYYYKLSTCQWSSNDMPAMIQSTTGEIIKDIEIENKLNLIYLPNEIKNFYKKIGTTMQEIYIKEWTFFSIENIIKMVENYKKNNIETIDFAYKYLGMGHVKVAFYDTRYKTIFYRNDGGSNGYDRNNNYINLKNFNNSNNSSNVNKYIGITFDTFLEEIVEKKLESAITF